MKRRLFTILSALFLLLFVVVRALAAVWASEKAGSGGKPSNSFVVCCALIAASTTVASAMWKLRFEETTFVVWVPLNAPADMIERCVQPYRKLPRAKIVVRFWTKGDCGGHATHE